MRRHRAGRASRIAFITCGDRGVLTSPRCGLTTAPIVDLPVDHGGHANSRKTRVIGEAVRWSHKTIASPRVKELTMVENDRPLSHGTGYARIHPC